MTLLEQSFGLVRVSSHRPARSPSSSAFHPILAFGIVATTTPHHWHQFRSARLQWRLLAWRTSEVRR